VFLLEYTISNSLKDFNVFGVQKSNIIETISHSALYFSLETGIEFKSILKTLFQEVHIYKTFVQELIDVISLSKSTKGVNSCENQL